MHGKYLLEKMNDGYNPLRITFNLVILGILISVFKF